MVWFTYMKFWQQFEIHKLFVRAKFQGNEFHNFRFWTQKLLQVWCKKRSYSKTVEVRQKTFHMVICIDGHQSVNR